mmetsp:Transcript_26486/g.23451  ORF Transcript_26486/g.23451 Transcript_26486/m.23451 type:complete len:137 (+) Transcript_26486:873-1283(+)
MKEIAGEKEYKRFQDIQIKMFMEKNINDIYICPIMNCNYFVFKDNADRAFYCDACKLSFCQKCDQEWHQGMSCEQKKKDLEEDVEFNEYVKETSCQKCPTCKRWVSRTEGCDKMTCLCGTGFCYICGAKDYNCPHH